MSLLPAATPEATCEVVQLGEVDAVHWLMACSG
jgi:hypothetical protein